MENEMKHEFSELSSDAMSDYTNKQLQIIENATTIVEETLTSHPNILVNISNLSTTLVTLISKCDESLPESPVGTRDQTVGLKSYFRPRLVSLHSSF